MERLRKTIIQEFIYESEDEKAIHKSVMEEYGFISINPSFSNQDWRTYGKYVKYE